MKHNTRIIFILLITISISYLICLPNIISMINNKVQENYYIKSVAKNNVLIKEINTLNKTINDLNDKKYMIENAEEYKEDLTNELKRKKEDIETINKNIEKLKSKIKSQKSKNEEIKKYIIK